MCSVHCHRIRVVVIFFIVYIHLRLTVCVHIHVYRYGWMYVRTYVCVCMVYCTVVQYCSTVRFRVHIPYNALRQLQWISSMSFICMRACHYSILFVFVKTLPHCMCMQLCECVKWCDVKYKCICFGWMDLLMHSYTFVYPCVYIVVCWHESHMCECCLFFFQSAVRLLTTSLRCQIPKYIHRCCCYCCCCCNMRVMHIHMEWKKIQLGWQIEATNLFRPTFHIHIGIFDSVGIWLFGILIQIFFYMCFMSSNRQENRWKRMS